MTIGVRYVSDNEAYKNSITMLLFTFILCVYYHPAVSGLRCASVIYFGSLRKQEYKARHMRLVPGALG